MGLKALAAASTVALALLCGTTLATASANAPTTPTPSTECHSPAQWAPESDFVQRSEDSGHALQIALTCDADGTTHWSAGDAQYGSKLITVRNEQGSLIQKLTLMSGPQAWSLEGYVVNKQGQHIWQEWYTDHVYPIGMTLYLWHLNAVVVTDADGTVEAIVLYHRSASGPRHIELRLSDGTYSVEEYKNFVRTGAWHKAKASTELFLAPPLDPKDADPHAGPVHLAPGTIKPDWEAMPHVDQKLLEAMPYHLD